MEINLAELKKLMPDNIIYDLIKALDGRTVTIKGTKEA